jgi:hypothetical protein
MFKTKKNLDKVYQGFLVSVGVAGSTTFLQHTVIQYFISKFLNMHT